MAVTWFAAVSKLVCGERQAAAYPCWVSQEQEAKVTLTRVEGDALELTYDVPVKLVPLATVRVPYGPFVEAILREAKCLLRFSKGMDAAIAEKARACAPSQRDRLADIERCLPRNVGGFVERIEEHRPDPQRKKSTARPSPRCT
eukprot:GGOE01063172.1.p1 GENE.GGOE01063172.1~~GGOE01063172.1.p1  ORF type:complete len:144 (+),score=22.67 GGOE01063172.1:277-708(+)